MKKLNEKQIAMIGGAFDCSTSGQMAFIAGGSTAEALAGGLLGSTALR
jgi:hypothetical protein